MSNSGAIYNGVPHIVSYMAVYSAAYSEILDNPKSPITTCI